MSHHIYARIPGVNHKEVMRHLCLEPRHQGAIDEQEFLDRYAEYEKRTQVAMLSRSAGNPLNQVLYIILGVMDEAYATCSGKGIDIDISKDQFVTALEILDKRSFADLKRSEIRLIGVAAVLDMVNGFFNSIIAPVNDTRDVDRERSFLVQCLAFCQKNGLDHLTVHFG